MCIRDSPGSVLQNIAYGSKSSEADIVAAAKVAEIHDFVESLPEGYNTQIGEGGHKLSGGQRQRISIARAVLKDAPILVLMLIESEASYCIASSKAVSIKTNPQP